jgi:hypothetical protein
MSMCTQLHTAGYFEDRLTGCVSHTAVYFTKFTIGEYINFSTLEYSETQISIQAPYHLVLSSREIHKLVTSIFGAQRWAFY